MPAVTHLFACDSPPLLDSRQPCNQMLPHLTNCSRGRLVRQTSVTLFIVLLLVCSQATAQDNRPSVRGAVAGRVTDRLTGQPIANAEVLAGDQEVAATSPSGTYRVELSPGTYTFRFSAPGYITLVASEISVTAGRTATKDIELDPAIAETVQVRSEVFASDTNLPVSHVTLSRAELRLIPGTGGDPLRAINSLPGVTSASAEFADLIVRGGSPGENLTFIENIPVNDFTYFTDRYDNGRGGRLGILPPDVFARLQFSAGGFGVRYGDKLSSATDIELRSAARERVQGTLYVDSGAAGVSLEIPIGKRGGWLFSMRRSYVDIAFDIVTLGEFGRPRNFDFINKFDFDLTPRHKLTVTALNFFERFTLSHDQALEIDRRIDQLETQRSGRRAILGTTLSSTLGQRTFSQLTLWGSGAHNDGTFLRLFPPMIMQRARDLRDSQFGIKEELTSAPTPRLAVSAGGGLIFEKANYFSFEESGFFFSPLEEEFLAPARNNRMRISTTASGYAYGQITWSLTPRISLTPGLRIDRYGISRETLLSPRASARIALGSKLAFNLATGMYRQPPALFVLSLTPENRSLKAERAFHLIGGLEWLFREDVRISVEAYQKSYGNHIVRPVLGSPIHVNSGAGRARGFDIAVQKALIGRFGGRPFTRFSDHVAASPKAGSNFLLTPNARISLL